MAKKAVQRLVRDPTGKLKLILIDLETLQPVTNTAGYEVINSFDQHVEEVTDVDAPDADDEEDATKTPETQDDLEQLESRVGGSGGRDSDGSLPGRAGTRTQADNFGYVNKPGWAGLANFAPGMIGMAAKAVNTGINMNNMAAVNAARKSMGLPEVSAGGMLKGSLKDQKGQVADVQIGDETYSVGLEAMTPDNRTNLTPDEARVRGALQGMQEIEKSPEAKQAKGLIGKAVEAAKGAVGLKSKAEVATPTPRETVSPSSTTAGRKSTTEDQIGDMPAGPHSAALSFGGLQGKGRNQKPEQAFNEKLADAVHGYFGPDYSVDVTSGKGTLKDKKGNPLGIGNSNHPSGLAADFDVVNNKTGQVVDNATMEDFGAYAASLGFGGVGIGPGYMTPGRMHLDIAHQNPTAWGAKGTAATMTPGVNSAIEMAGVTGAPVHGMGLPGPGAPTPFGPDQMNPNNLRPSMETTNTVASQVIDQAATPIGMSPNAMTPDQVSKMSPAAMVAQGMKSLTDEEVSSLNHMIAGELAPGTLKGIVEGQPEALAEYASAVTTAVNRASTAKYGSIAGAMQPSQYNSLMPENIETTNHNFGIYGPALNQAWGQYVAGTVQPPSYDLTSYYNSSLVSPGWGTQMKNTQMVGQHLFGSLPEYEAYTADFYAERQRTAEALETNRSMPGRYDAGEYGLDGAYSRGTSGRTPGQGRVDTSRDVGSQGTGSGGFGGVGMGSSVGGENAGRGGSGGTYGGSSGPERGGSTPGGGTSYGGRSPGSQGTGSGGFGGMGAGGSVSAENAGRGSSASSSSGSRGGYGSNHAAERERDSSASPGGSASRGGASAGGRNRGEY